MVGPRVVTVVFLMVAASTWTAVVQAAAVPKAIAGSSRNAESSTNAVAPPYAELSISVTDLLSALENGTNDTRLQAAINDLELQPQQQFFQQQKQQQQQEQQQEQQRQQEQQQQQQPRKFRHEASAVRILYQIGVSIFD